MSNKKTNLPFNPHEKPQGMGDEEWRGIDSLNRLDLKTTAIKAFHTRQERAAEEEAKRPAEPPTKAKPPKVGYVARELVLLNLPCRKPIGDVWARKNGDLSLIVQGGYRVDQKTGKPINIGVPYGATARLVLFYIMSAAAFSETRRIYLGNSFDAFLKTIGASPERRGVKTGARAVLNQLERLINASFKIQLCTENEDFNVERIKPLPLISDSEIWFSKKKGDNTQKGLWSSYVEISEELFQSLKKNPIPIDWDVILKIRKNPTALDFYALLTYESAKAQATGKGRFIPWASLRDQMGNEATRLNNFSAKARTAIKEIQKYYKGLKVSFIKEGGIRIEAGSTPSVPSNSPLKRPPAAKVVTTPPQR